MVAQFKMFKNLPTLQCLYQKIEKKGVLAAGRRGESQRFVLFIGWTNKKIIYMYIHATKQKQTVIVRWAGELENLGAQSHKYHY